MFFCNSGTEANEVAFKITRLTGRTKLVAAQGAFHGRTMGSLALTGQPAKQEPFAPLPGDVAHVPYGDVDALAAAVDDATAAVFLEPIMGEGGVVVPPAGYLVAAREITAEHGALLVLDEVQTGMGRTGTFFAHQHDGITPDIVTLAKGLGGGLPIGACLAVGDDRRSCSTPGLHGSTFGGNPVCAAAALAVLQGAGRRRSDRPRRRARQDAAATASSRWAIRSSTTSAAAGLLRGVVLTRTGGQAGRGGGTRRRVPGQRRCAGRDPAGAAAGHHRGADRRVPRRAARRAGQGGVRR